MEQQEKKCPACSAELELARTKVPLGNQNGGFLSLFDDTIDVDVYRCAQCGRVELYESAPYAPLIEEGEQITCPQCGNTHSARIGCPRCALNGVNGSKYVSPQTDRKKKERKKPPWER